jgi:hypothetical protein
LDSYSADFFIPNFFLLSGLGAGTAPKALAGTVSPTEGRVCFGGATAMVTNEPRPAMGDDCPGVAPAEPDDGSTVIEGTLCSLTLSSLTLRFECLGFEELAEQNQEKGRIQQNSATAN